VFHAAIFGITACSMFPCFLTTPLRPSKPQYDQLRGVVGLLTGHFHLKGHLFKLGLTDDPICERCLEEDESATHTMYPV
jgi:hypothetical protein